MPRKVLQDFANTLPAMLVGWRMYEDLEVIADLPDGTLTIDVLRGAASHSENQGVSLHIAGELQAWIQSRMQELGIPNDLREAATVQADISTNRVATDRKRIVAFEFKCRSFLVAGARTYTGSLAERVEWHRRLAR